MSRERKRLVDIPLTGESHRCLMEHLSEHAPAYKPLSDAVHLTGSAETADVYVVKCDLDDAESLLAAAKRDCRPTVTAIELAIRIYRSGKEG